MKRIFTSIIMLCMLITSIASEHYHLSLREENIQLNEFTSNLHSYFEIPEQSSFLLLDEITDDLGFKHLRYQQYYNSIKIEHAIIQIHAKNNIVQSISGWVMKSEPEISMNRNLLNTQDENTMYIKINEEYRLAKKITKDSYNIYIDVETGEELNRISLYHFANPVGKIETMYNGWQYSTTYEDDGYYYLLDETRCIATLDATGIVHPIDENNPPDEIKDKLNSCTSQKEALQVVNEWISNEFKIYTDKCRPYYNTSNTWNKRNTVNKLTSITINQILDTDWCGNLDTPDLYIKVYQNSNLIYKTPIINNLSNSYTFYFDIILGSNYFIEIYDEDLDNDDLAATISLDNFLVANEYKLKNNNIYLTLNLQQYSNDNMAFNAHWGMQKTYDYFLKTFKRKSFDNKSSIIYQFINPTKTFLHQKNEGISMNANAYHNIVNYIIYGIGDEITLSPLVSLDIIAHEFTHLVTAHNKDCENKGLIYQGESGALNESFSDIFATCVEYDVNGIDANWTIGEDITIKTPYLRNISNPNLSYSNEKLEASPDTYKGDYFKDPTNIDNDYGGVHTNSGVQNFWFYLLCEGGEGINDNGDSYKVKGIGIKNAEQIAYRNLIHYLPSDATFDDARFGSIESCKDLFPNNQSFVESVTNAWYAVGVGNEITSTIDENSINDNICVKDGHISYNSDFTIYNTIGQDVTAFNGSLQPGVYLVSIENNIVKVMVK